MKQTRFIDAMLSPGGIAAAKRLLDEAPCLSTMIYKDGEVLAMKKRKKSKGKRGC